MMYGAKKSDTGIVAMKAANKAVTGRCGVAGAKAGDRRESARPKHGTDPEPRNRDTGGRTDTACPRGSRSLPKVGAVCVNAPVRICAGGAGQPASLPRVRQAWRVAP